MDGVDLAARSHSRAYMKSANLVQIKVVDSEFSKVLKCHGSEELLCNLCTSKQDVSGSCC